MRYRHRALGLFASALLATSCGQDTSLINSSESRSDLDANREMIPEGLEFGIVGGQVVAAGDELVRSTVMLPSGCSGTLISDKHVLTAGHCVDGVKVSSIKFGVRGEKGTASVTAVKASPAFVGSSSINKVSGATFAANDYAILTFSGSIPTGFGWVGMPPSAIDIKQTYAEIYIAGYGLTSGGGRDFGTLHKVQIPISNITQTQGAIRINVPGKTACNGDSGGPVYGKKSNGTIEVIGVVSNGDVGCTGSGYYGDVSRAQTWIQSVTGALTPPPGSTPAPTPMPTVQPDPLPTVQPDPQPTVMPTVMPTAQPTVMPPPAQTPQPQPPTTTPEPADGSKRTLVIVKAKVGAEADTKGSLHAMKTLFADVFGRVPPDFVAASWSRDLETGEASLAEFRSYFAHSRPTRWNINFLYQVCLKRGPSQDEMAQAQTWLSGANAQIFEFADKMSKSDEAVSKGSPCVIKAREFE